MMIRKDIGGGIDGLISKLKDIDKKNVYVGVPSSENKSVNGEINMATLAAVHEFGAKIEQQGGVRYQERSRGNLATFVRSDFVGPTSGVTGAHTVVIPERSFLRSTINENNSKYVELINKGVRSVIAGEYDADGLYERLGLIISNDVKAKMISGDFVPNSPRTIKKKGSSKPLIDTGELRSSISYEVR